MILVGAMSSSDTEIYFQGPSGYNNAVYTLNIKCSNLYQNELKGIVARSIKIEDITDRFSNTGISEASTYINNQIESLDSYYITAIDSDNNKVTYRRTRGYYPDIFKYEVGGLLDGIATTGEITGSQSYSGYNGLTEETYSQVTNINGGGLTVPYTYYTLTPTDSYFDDTNNYASIYKDIFFTRMDSYWLASRSIKCEDYAYFYLRRVHGGLNGINLYRSDTYTGYNGSSRVCPIITIPSDIEVTPCTGTNSRSNPHIVVAE